VRKMTEAKKQTIKPAKAKEKTEVAVKTPALPESGNYLVAVRLRGGRRTDIKQKTTLEQLNLRNQHNCIIVPDKPTYVGMLKLVKDYITWGIISVELKQEIEAKKTEKLGDGTTRKYFRLNPPRGGFEKEGIKVAYSLGGALGYRGHKIDALIKRML